MGCIVKNSQINKTAQVLDFKCKDFNVHIINMFKELKQIIFQELKENMILIKESLQGNENYKNLPYGNSQTEKFNN